MIFITYLFGVVYLTLKFFVQKTTEGPWKFPNWLWTLFIIFWPISYMIIGLLYFERWMKKDK